MFGLSLSPLFYFGAVVAVLSGLYWVHDKIGDVREAEVHAAYKRAADWKNRDLGASNVNEERAFALMEGALKSAVEAAQKVQGSCQATPARCVRARTEGRCQTLRPYYAAGCCYRS